MTRNRGSIPAEFFPPFNTLEPPEWTLPLVLSVPHAGALYPPGFTAETRLSVEALRTVEDAFVDELYLGVQGLGVPLLKAVAPRSYLDMNRHMYEFDPKLYRAPLPAWCRTDSTKVMNGLGVVPRTIGDGMEIYDRRRDFEEDLPRIEYLYKPYHARLRQLLRDGCGRFGAVLLVDCHSMPSHSRTPGTGYNPPDVVLGDCFGKACPGDVVNRLEAAFQKQGYSTLINNPFPGGFITGHYGKPKQNCFAVQVEINRALYMDETRLEKTAESFLRVQSDLAMVFFSVADYLKRVYPGH
ncbi:MAG: N-formylglutamate amidohydrolase [Methylobacteriaceae bacterium]|nr:N-formylglutamate amidohydrolase [Methylobacteriaceae bacterium]